jgi:tetratricopeptide (TPR) repeat protein
VATRFERNVCGAHCKPTATALASLGILTLGFAPFGNPGGADAADPDPVVVAAEEGAPPRALMRVPQWIESFGSSRRAETVEQPLRLAADFSGATNTAGSFEPDAQASSTDLPPVAGSSAEAVNAPARLPASPGGRLLRRHQGEPRSFATLTSGWTEISGDEAVESESISAPANETLGPDSSVLNGENADGVEEPQAEQSAELTAGEPSAVDEGQSVLEVPANAEESAEEPAVEENAVVGAIDVTELETDFPAVEEVAAETADSEAGDRQLELPPQPSPRDSAPTLAIDAASFRGVLPGTTTREELLASWGEGKPFSRPDGSEGLAWEMPPFQRVEVMLGEDVVSSIYIRLAKPATVDALSAQLEINDLRTVSLVDADGVAIGEVFPERGVIFSLDPENSLATAVMLEPLDPEAFVLRAEGELNTSVANALTDLQYAVEVDPEYRRAHRLLLVLLCDQGKWARAAEVAEAAETLSPDDSWTLLKHGSVMLALCRFEEAAMKTQQVLESPEVPPLVRAQAERQLGRIELAGPSPDYQQALNHFTAAIKHAAPLVNSPTTPIRRAALDIQFDSHLGTALAIANGTWQQKDKVLPKWIARAEGFARQLSEDEGGNPTLELRLCRGALAISAASTDGDSPMPWIKRLLAVRSAFGGMVTDPWRRRQIDWEVGQALSDALTAAQIRGDTTDMLDNATLTAAYLERGGQQRDLTPDERREFGDLLFRIGILYSLQKGDHDTAVTWFDKVLPLWERNDSFTARGELGRLGEAYVSMAISYWQVDRRTEAVDLSSTGVDMMVTAVDAEQLDEQALAVAYGNLSTMYADQGDSERSEMYAEMASRAEASGTRQ